VRRLLATGLALAAVMALAACGAHPATHVAPLSTRAAIARVIRAKYVHLPVGGKPAAKIDVGPVRLARSDPSYALTTLTPRDGKGRQLDDTAALVLHETNGTWKIVLGPGTAFPDACRPKAPLPIRQLMCPDPFRVIAHG
jgi:hypothetical protein